MITHLKDGDASSRFERETAVMPISMSFHWISFRDFFSGREDSETHGKYQKGRPENHIPADPQIVFSICVLFHREDFLENRSGLVTVHTEGVSDILFALVERLGGHLGFAHSHLVLHH